MSAEPGDRNFALPRLNFPVYSFTFRESGGKREIFDPFRKKYVVLTPEEWVRQHMVQYLMTGLGVPGGWIVLEKTLIFNKMTMRADILVYGKNHLPIMMVECKAPGIQLTQATLEQISRYNLIFKVEYLLITNGLQHFAFRIDVSGGEVNTLSHLPHWTEISQ